MKWRGAVLGLLVLLGLAQGGPGASQGVPDRCSMQCSQVYSLHTNQYEQVRPSLEACQTGCEFFSRIEARNGFQDALGNLQNCNYSCDERFSGPLLPACQSGCGFHFDSDVSARRVSAGPPVSRPSPPSAPTFTRGPPPPPQATFSRGPSPSAPSFPRARGPAFSRPPQSPPQGLSQGPPRPTVFMTEEPAVSQGQRMAPETPQSSIQTEIMPPRVGHGDFLPPRVPLLRSGNPLMNILRSQGPVMLRPQSFNVTPQRVTPIMKTERVTPIMKTPPPRPTNMVTKENPRGPTIIGFSLPQLLSRVSSIIPQMEQVLPQVQQNIEGMPSIQQIFNSLEEQEPKEEPRHRPVMEFSLPSMDQVFSRIEQVLPDMEQRQRPHPMGRIMEIEIENPFTEFEEEPRMTMPRIPGGFFGVKDDEHFGGFGGFFDQLTDHMMSSEFSQSWNPFGSPSEHSGKLTIIKAGPGFHQEQHFDVGPDGNLIEITETPIHQDGLSHENPMDVHFNSNDVEVFHGDKNDIEGDAEIFDSLKATGEEAKEPVMDVWAVEDEDDKEDEEDDKESAETTAETNVAAEAEVKSEPLTEARESLPEALPEVDSVEFSPKDLPFLAVLKNTVEANERMLDRYRTLADSQYRDDYTCNSDHLKWSDWVACLHARVGVPRWLTAATISLGIVFSVWLCLVIPSAAPKQRMRALVIRTENQKPSTALAKAKEAEAAATAKACEAAGVDPNSVVSVVRVDLPPSYGSVRPPSPAPSYKSEMGVPGSPAPSYRSVDIPAEKPEEPKGEKVVLEPVHPGSKETTA